jgi:hypothetical protein
VKVEVQETGEPVANVASPSWKEKLHAWMNSARHVILFLAATIATWIGNQEEDREISDVDLPRWLNPVQG